MRAWVVVILRRLLDWLDPPPPPTPMDLVARRLVADMETRGLAPEHERYKRAWVYARLIKQFPDARRRDVSLALEQAVRIVKP